MASRSNMRYQQKQNENELLDNENSYNDVEYAQKSSNNNILLNSTDSMDQVEKLMVLPEKQTMVPKISL